MFEGAARCYERSIDHTHPFEKEGVVVFRSGGFAANQRISGMQFHSWAIRIDHDVLTCPQKLAAPEVALHKNRRLVGKVGPPKVVYVLRSTIRVDPSLGVDMLECRVQVFAIRSVIVV